MLQPLDLIDIGVLYDCIAIPVLSTQTQEQLLGHLSSVSRRYFCTARDQSIWSDSAEAIQEVE
jgi:hypothetical protein